LSLRRASYGKSCPNKPAGRRKLRVRTPAHGPLAAQAGFLPFARRECRYVHHRRLDGRRPVDGDSRARPNEKAKRSRARPPVCLAGHFAGADLAAVSTAFSDGGIVVGVLMVHPVASLE